VSISQQTVAENLKAHEMLKLRFPILSDRGARIAEQFGVRWRVPKPLRDIHRKSGIDLPLLDGDESWTLPIPARFILDRAGVIVYSQVNPGHSSPSNARDVLPVLDHLRSRCGARVGTSLRRPGCLEERRRGYAAARRRDRHSNSGSETPFCERRPELHRRACVNGRLPHDRITNLAHAQLHKAFP
jgi:hypothetical protein